MPVCSVITCKYAQDDCDPALDGIVFHRFPKNEEMRAKWIDMTGHDKWTPSSKDGICSRHFRDNDYFIKRSGKRYLKTAAIPCEYVVYRHLFPDEVVSEVKVETEVEANEVGEVAVFEDQVPKVVVQHEPEMDYEMNQEPQPGPSHWFAPQTSKPDEVVPEVKVETEVESNEVGEVTVFEDQVPKVVVQHEPEMDYVMNQEPQPGPSHWFAPQTSRATSSQEPDSTIATIYDNKTIQEWERFQNDRFVGYRLPASIFEDSSQDVDSSGFDEHYRREEGSVNPYRPELDLRPHLQPLPPPRTPEPVVPVFDEPESNLGFEMEQIPEDDPSAVVEILNARQKLEDIRKIMAKRKSGRKAIAAALAEVLEAHKVKDQLETGELNNNEKAIAIIDLQTKRIVKLDIIYRRLRKILKRISAVLRND